jgi:hypothetical protein
VIVILNARAGAAAKSGNLQSRIAALFGGAGLNVEIISVAGKDLSAAAEQAVAENHETIRNRSAVRSIFSQLNDLSGPVMAGRRHDSFQENVSTILPKLRFDSMRLCASRISSTR